MNGFSKCLPSLIGLRCSLAVDYQLINSHSQSHSLDEVRDELALLWFAIESNSFEHNFGQLNEGKDGLTAEMPTYPCITEMPPALTHPHTHRHIGRQMATQRRHIASRQPQRKFTLAASRHDSSLVEQINYITAGKIHSFIHSLFWNATEGEKCQNFARF